ncbi:uncharacterized protein VTP21DRAFT_5002 [Calcarisporiella thermophila]|uniref:uncharacterized protein n=1 Tax=Calcarisporiella thermophila TaxID=911321 RepID=UPI003744A5A2
MEQIPPTNSATTAHSQVESIAEETAPAVDQTEVDRAAEVLKNQKIIEEFQYLLEKSQQLFAGLRDLPPTGTRQWQPYFQRTFEVYTKLWKFQQQHRVILENKENYGLKRWELGEIASKIGQLYYHYYLRTSETNYLHESFIFYEAIRDRAYFKDVLEAKNPALMIKKLRYYARFIVVCLLLDKRSLVRTLVDELSTIIDSYSKTFKPTDAVEWQMVLQEINMFVEAKKKLIPTTPEGDQLSFPRRLPQDRCASVEMDDATRLHLQEAILVGNHQNQIKFSELTLDMYYILQSLEREPTIPLRHQYQRGNESSEKPQGQEEEEEEESKPKEKPNVRRQNPHKYLLYRPTFSQLMVYIATAFKEINDNSALLVYISADGIDMQNNENADNGVAPLAGYTSGVATHQRRQTDKSDATVSNHIHGLYPGDLVPFTRKPLLLIIDSPKSVAFKSMPRMFNQPLFALLAPTEYPSAIQDVSQIGSLFTLFLHAPILGFSFVSDIAEMTQEVWGQCIKVVEQMEDKALELLNSSSLDKSVKRFLQDDFLRLFVARFVLCHVILRAHTSFKQEQHYPSSSPPLPDTVLFSPELKTMLKELAGLAHVEQYYAF